MTRYSTLLKSGFVLLLGILCMPCFLILSIVSMDLPPLGIALMTTVFVFSVLPLVWSNIKPVYAHIRHFQREAYERSMHHRKIFALDRAYKQKLDQYHREVRLNKFRSLSDLQEMTPKEFEHHVAYIFQQMGYQTDVLGGAGDRGVDIEAWRGDELVIVQCKRYKKSNKVGSPAVRNFLGAMSIAKPHRGFFVTTSSFTEPAHRDAASNPSVTLVDGSGIINWWQEYKIGPFKQFTYPQPPEYPPPPPTSPPPPVPAITIMGFSVWQWIVLMILSEITLAVMSVLASLLLS